MLYTIGSDGVLYSSINRVLSYGYTATRKKLSVYEYEYSTSTVLVSHTS